MITIDIYRDKELVSQIRHHLDLDQSWDLDQIRHLADQAVGLDAWNNLVVNKL